MSLYQKICAWVPKHIGNGFILWFYETAGALQKIRVFNNRRKSLKNRGINAKTVMNHSSFIEKNMGYIEDQNSYTDMKYGKTTMQYAGCEIFSVYNALVGLQKASDKTGNTKKVEQPNLVDLISHFERDGMAFSGRIGTSPKALIRYFRKQGYATRVSRERSQFVGIADECETMILTMYNDGNDLRNEIHTITITKEDGKYVAHNVYCNGRILKANSFVELMNLINGGKAKGISLIGIRA